MKKTLAVLAVLSIMIFGFVLAAQAETTRAVKINVPFAFQAGNQVMPAGDYIFEFPKANNDATGSMLKIFSPDGSLCQYLLSRSIRGIDTDSEWHVTFNKYGDFYFIAKVRNSELGAEVAKTRAEKQMAAQQLQALEPVATVELKTSFTREK